MPKLIIDNREVTVPEGTNVLEAARQLDIVIPHFCYHEALGSVGSCRLCAMTFLEGSVQGVQMACMVKAEDGMVVSSTDEDAAELRAHVIEWLMTKHPHDCPVCDEGGECMLQDMTVAGGHSLRRYTGKKQTFNNQKLGPFVEQEMNRCITCYRCVRTYRDYCGGTDFGVFGSRNRVVFGRTHEGRLESPFSGNLVDVCPTGVFTNKPFRFKSRSWDLQEAPSICPHCSLGCATIPGGRYRELQRVRAGVNPDTNGFFICDRGRFGYDHVNHPERPRQARVDGQPASLDETIASARQRITELVEQHGPESVAFIGSSRSSLEANLLLKQWANKLGCNNLVFEAHEERDQVARTLTARLGDHACSLADIRSSDLVILVGADPLSEGPMAALAIRQAARNGAPVFVIDPRPVELPCAFTHLPIEPARLAEVIDILASGKLSAFTGEPRNTLDLILQALDKAASPVLVGGHALSSKSVGKLLATADTLGSANRPVGVMQLLNGPNSFGGALLAGEAAGFETLLDDIQEGTVKAMVCLEADPFREVRDPAKAQAALGHLEFLVALDATPNLSAHRADIFFPTCATSEATGCFINNEGRLQEFQKVIDPGLPIRVTGEGGHPPREFSRETPGDQPRPAWEILSRILNGPDDLVDLRSWLTETNEDFKKLVGPGSDGRLAAKGVLPSAADEELPHVAAPDTLQMLSVPALFGSDWLAHLSSTLDPVKPAPTVWIHTDQARELDLHEGDLARLTTQLGHCSVTVRVSERMAPDLVIAPHLWETALEGMPPGSRSLDCRLEKEERS